MNILVTGGAGFFGSHLIPVLLEKGVDVVAFDIAKQPASLSSVLDRITYVRGDLASPADLYRAVASHEITDVFHLGAILAGPCEENPVVGFQVNFLSTLTLLDASLALKVRRFVMASSISVFGRDVQEPVPDNAPKNPTNIYGQTKLASEHLLLWYARKHGLDTRGVRLAWVFGPGRTTGITAPYTSFLLDAIARGEALEVTNPDEIGDWIYIKDVVKAILCAWETENPRQRIYNISGSVRSVREVIEVATRYRPDSRVTFREAETRLSPYPAHYDDSVAREELGWEPSYNIEDAVREHLDIVSRGVSIREDYSFAP